MATDSNGAERSCEYAGENRSGDRTGEILVDIAEEFGKWRGIISRERPPRAGDCQERGDETRRRGQEDDEQQTESGAGAVGALPVHLSKGE